MMWPGVKICGIYPCDVVECPACNGTGQLVECRDPSFEVSLRTCDCCAGTGETIIPRAGHSPDEVKEAIFEAIHNLRIAITCPAEREQCARYVLSLLESLVFEGGAP